MKKTTINKERLAKITLIIAIIKLSLKKILNTSLLLAPTALKIPISLFLWLIEIVIKFNNKRDAKIAKPSPIYKKIFEQISKIEYSVEQLENSGIYLDININELKEIIEEPQDFDIKPSDLVDDYMFNVDNIKDDICRLYHLLDKLQDLLYNKDL